jgi:dipeptidyl aminopeptidase/acylaminoacyl peptidase
MSTPAKPATPGSWKSPITLDAVFADAVGLGSVSVRGEDLYWLESRVAEAGRSVLVHRAADGECRDLIEAPLSLRSRVHEYGGGAYVLGDGVLYFSNDADQALYAMNLGTRDVSVIAGETGLRYADAIIDRTRRRLIVVREDHRIANREPVNTLVAIALDAPHAQSVLRSGADFYSSPRLSADGRQLAWLSWMHPNMPWDGNNLWLADVDADGTIATTALIAGGDGESTGESIFQPEFSPRGELIFVSDRSGWWNLYRWHRGQVQALHEMDAEFGAPQWTFGMSLYGFESSGQIVCSLRRRGDSQLALIDIDRGKLTEIATPYRDIADVRVGDGFVVFIGGSPTQAPALVRLDLDSCRCEVLRQSSPLQIDEAYVSVPQAIAFPTTDGKTAHAFFYAPRNRDYVMPDGVLPPLRVLNHGGPTSATTATFSAAIQYWTSRGFAIVDVNYGGSSGYGRAYRQRLNGQWGVVDVDDAVNAARYLVERDLVDGEKLCIKGGSAGGYTTLAALTFRDTFKAGASYYGIGDLETLARDTHKFESRYMDSLVGPYPAMQALYRERSPIHHSDRLSTPLILFQGLLDKVVPPNQSQAMFDAVRAKGLPVAYVSFPNERHGFRALEANRRALSAEFYFYGKVFGFDPADEIEPVDIVNL